MDVPRAEALARLHEHGVADVVRHVVGSPAPRRRDPVGHEEAVSLQLVRHAPRRIRVGQEDERGRQSVAFAGENREVEVVQRDDETDVVLLSKRRQRGHIRRIGDPRDDDVPVAVIQSGRERIGVDTKRDGARGTERADDVDALPDRGEHDDHDARAYSEESAATWLRSAPCRSRSVSSASSRA